MQELMQRLRSDPPLFVCFFPRTMVRGIFLTVVFVYFFLSTYHITVCTYITAGNDVAWVLTHIYI